MTNDKTLHYKFDLQFQGYQGHSNYSHLKLQKCLKLSSLGIEVLYHSSARSSKPLSRSQQAWTFSREIYGNSSNQMDFAWWILRDFCILTMLCNIVIIFASLKSCEHLLMKSCKLCRCWWIHGFCNFP